MTRRQLDDHMVIRLEWHMILLLREIVLVASINKALNSSTVQTLTPDQQREWFLATLCGSNMRLNGVNPQFSNCGAQRNPRNAFLKMKPAKNI